MKLLNEKVTHTKFGIGVIKSNENGIIQIYFNESYGEKAFVYPDAFEQYLKLENSALDQQVQNELKVKLDKILKEKETQRIESERLAEEVRLREEEKHKHKLELMKQKKKSTKTNIKKVKMNT